MEVFKRYAELKSGANGAIVLMRVGDFYESFFDDATTIARVLGLTITTREKRSENPVPMAGFPYYSLDGYLQKLVAAGHRVAVAEMK